MVEDEHLGAFARDAERALASAGLTVEDLPEVLPAARAAVVSESYDAAFLEEVSRLHAQSAAAVDTCRTQEVRPAHAARW